MSIQSKKGAKKKLSDFISSIILPNENLNSISKVIHKTKEVQSSQDNLQISKLLQFLRTDEQSLSQSQEKIKESQTV